MHTDLVFSAEVVPVLDGVGSQEVRGGAVLNQDGLVRENWGAKTRSPLVWINVQYSPNSIVDIFSSHADLLVS